MIVQFEKQRPKLHEWLYDITLSICHDRDYAYKAYYEVFCMIMSDVFMKGALTEKGSATIYGIKSDYNANIDYSLKHRLNYIGLNEIHFKCDIFNKVTNGMEETHEISFELSSGEAIK